MTATLAPAPPQQRRGGRGRIAGLERPLLAGGLALVTIHLLDLAFSGPHTWLLAIAGILAVPLAWWFAQPHVTRPTRFGLGLVVGLLSIGFGVVSHGLHVVNSGPDRYDITGIAMIARRPAARGVRRDGPRRTAAPAPARGSRLARRAPRRLGARRGARSRSTW